MQEAVPSATCLGELILPSSWTTKNPLYIYSGTERSKDSQSGALACQSYSLPSHDYKQDTVFHCRDWRAVASQEATDNIVTDSVYVSHILTHNFPGILHSLPYYGSQGCRSLWGFHHKCPISLGSKGWEKSTDTNIVKIDNVRVFWIFIQHSLKHLIKLQSG